MMHWTDYELRQGDDDPRPIKVDWWALLGLMALIVSAIGLTMAVGNGITWLLGR